jgi:alpha-glucosidase
MIRPAVEAVGKAAASPTDQPWWHGGVLYESHLPSFADSDGDGVGDLGGLIGKLPYLADTLGVDAVWVGPFFRSPLLDQGFDISDHTDVEPVFGTRATVDRLVREAHDHDFKIIIDYVPNHTSEQHPWFVESRSSRTSARRDWYVWRDGKPDGSPPNNWVAEPGGSAWQHDPRTGQFYLHSHLVEQPDLNWRHPPVRAAMLDVLRFWLDRGVDGVRIDVAHMLMKDPLLRDNPPSPGGTANPYDVQHPDFHTQLHIHDRLHPDVHGALREIRAVLDSYRDRVAIAEIEAMAWSGWRSFFGEAREPRRGHSDGRLDEIQLPFAFRLIETPWRAPELADELQQLEAALPEGGWPILALGNHDRPRLASRIGSAQARVAAMLLLTLRGTPCLFYGDELGLVNQDVPADRMRDHFGLTAGGISRDPIRTPMPWTAGPTGGFSTAAEERLWLPPYRDRATVNVDRQLADPRSLLNLFRGLLRLRRRSPALRAGSYRHLHPTGSADQPARGVLAYARQHGDERKIIALNLTATPVTVPLPGTGEVVLSTGLDRAGEPVSFTVELRGDEGMVVDIAGSRP